jgi:hypothetical protein
MENLENLKSLLKDIQLKKFKRTETIYDPTRNKNSWTVLTRVFNDKNLIKQDKRYEESKQLLEFFYYEKEYGIKYMIKYLELPITYSVLRFSLIEIFNIKLRSYNEITNHIHKIRKEKALKEIKNKTGWGSQESIDKVKSKNSIARGIQGYYLNKSLNKYVWLRSSWEYIFAKWIDNKNMVWDVECKTYNINEQIIYKPDFFIFDEVRDITKIKQIIEIKGYWKDKVYKYEEIKKYLKDDKIQFSLITDITPYSEIGVKKDIKEWKQKRILEI